MSTSIRHGAPAAARQGAPRVDQDPLVAASSLLRVPTVEARLRYVASVLEVTTQAAGEVGRDSMQCLLDAAIAELGAVTGVLPAVVQNLPAAMDDELEARGISRAQLAEIVAAKLRAL